MTPPPLPSVLPPLREKSPDEPLVVLLAGAYLPWYDYSLVADAVATLSFEDARRVKLRVLGGNPRQPEMEASVRKTLTSGENAEIVEFVGLVPFEKRFEYYRTADVALALGGSSVEDDLSARTRVVDYLGSHLPILSPGTDEYAFEIVAGGAGFAYATAKDLAHWFVRLSHEPGLLVHARDRIPPLLAGPFNGKEAAKPVLEFIDHPRLLPRVRSGREIIRTAGLWLRDALATLRQGKP